MRRSARVQALETIKRRKLTKRNVGESHVTDGGQQSASDHVSQGRSSKADKSTTVVGQRDHTNHVTSTHGNHVTQGSNGNHVTPKPATSGNHHMTITATSPPQFRTTRAQAKLLSQQTPTTLTNHINSPGHVTLDRFRYSQKIKSEPEETQVKIEGDLESDNFKSRDIKPESDDPRDLKPESDDPSDIKRDHSLTSSYFIKPEPNLPTISDIEECHTFSAPEEFNVAENPGVLSQPGPRDWGAIYARVKKMRSLVNAPVDTMGCERLVQDGVPAKVQRFQLLISLMLSSQTKDEVTCQAVLNLREYLKSRDLLLSVEGILSMSIAEIDSCICKVGFHNRKADYISRATALLVSDFDGDIPPTIEAMTSLPGVGPKMAHLLMHRGWGVNEGIGVDVHVHRLSNMWGWVKSKTPEETRVQLEKWLPRELWVDINPTLVGFGQTVCPSKGKKCGVCILDKGLCKARIEGMEWRSEKWMGVGYEELEKETGI